MEALVARGIPVRALVRNAATARDQLPAEVELVVGDVLKPQKLEDAIGDSTVLLCATGASPSLDFTEPYRVDYLGTKNLIEAARRKQIQQFVIVSSLCVSQFFHFLNLFWLVLWWKKLAEGELQRSGLTYTIARPGGLRNDDDSSDPLVMQGADTLFGGSIPRRRVAQVCVEALFEPDARNKILEIVTQQEAKEQGIPELFAQVN